MSSGTGARVPRAACRVPHVQRVRPAPLLCPRPPTPATPTHPAERGHQTAAFACVCAHPAGLSCVCAHPAPLMPATRAGRARWAGTSAEITAASASPCSCDGSSIHTPSPLYALPACICAWRPRARAHVFLLVHVCHVQIWACAYTWHVHMHGMRIYEMCMHIRDVYI